MAVKPITGMLRRGLVLDLSVAFGMPLRARPPEEITQQASSQGSKHASKARWMY
jgi:hypothetical protein